MKTRWLKGKVLGHFPKCGEVRALPAPRSCVFASRGWPAKLTRQKLYFRHSEITELRTCVGSRYGSLAICQNVAKLGPSPPHGAASLRRAVGHHSRRARIYISEIPKLRTCENALTRGRGLWPFPKTWRNWVPPRPMYLRFCVKQLALVADAPEFIYPKFRNYGITKMRWPKEGVFGHFPKCGEVRALPAPRHCVFVSSSWPS